jgi:hypothetical protein
MKYPIILSLVYLSSFFPVQAWSNHGLGTWVAFSQTPEVASAPFIPVESLESFLEKEKLGIQKVLLENEEYILSENEWNLSSHFRFSSFSSSI